MGYIGQTLRDFLDEAIDNDGNITLSDINEDDFEDSIVYEGSISDIPEELLDCEFSEFDTGEGITINVSEEGFSRYYTTLEDFLEDCNEYNITIWDTDLEKIIYDGDKYDIPDEILEMGFESFDMPTNICCNIDTGDYDKDINDSNCKFKDSIDELDRDTILQQIAMEMREYEGKKIQIRDVCAEIADNLGLSLINTHGLHFNGTTFTVCRNVNVNGRKLQEIIGYFKAVQQIYGSKGYIYLYDCTHDGDLNTDRGYYEEVEVIAR